MSNFSRLTPSRWMEAIAMKSPRTAATGPVRIAVIGCGEVAQTAHLLLLRRLNDFTVVGLADTNPVALQACAPLAKRAAQTADYRELLTPWIADATGGNHVPRLYVKRIEAIVVTYHSNSSRGLPCVDHR